AGEILRTWRLLEMPAAGRQIRAEALGDHRIAYLNYEGPLSGNRGAVARVDAGEFVIVDETPGQIDLEFSGLVVSGRWQMRRESEDDWILVKNGSEPRMSARPSELPGG